MKVKQRYEGGSVLPESEAGATGWTPPPPASGAGPGGRGIRLGRWELRSDLESWVVGVYNERDSRLKQPRYAHYLGHALRVMHNRLTLDCFRTEGVRALKDLIRIHGEQYQALLDAFGHLTTKEYPSW